MSKFIVTLGGLRSEEDLIDMWIAQFYDCPHCGQLQIGPMHRDGEGGWTCGPSRIVQEETDGPSASTGSTGQSPARR